MSHTLLFCFVFNWLVNFIASDPRRYFCHLQQANGTSLATHFRNAIAQSLWALLPKAIAVHIIAMAMLSFVYEFPGSLKPLFQGLLVHLDACVGRSQADVSV